MTIFYFFPDYFLSIRYSTYNMAGGLKNGCKNGNKAALHRTQKQPDANKQAMFA
jgi:hypothetical protein